MTKGQTTAQLSVRLARQTLPLVTRAGHWLASWHARHCSRVALSHLDDHLLRDIGLTALARADECAKAPWQD